MDKVTLNIILVLLISFIVCFLVYLGIVLILIPYWDKGNKKENEKKNEKKNNKNYCSTAQNSTLKRFLTPGQRVSTLEQDGIYYKPYFDKEKGLYIPTIFAQRNIVYYQLIPLNVLSDIHNYFAEEITQALLKNNKENNNKENNEQGE